MLKIPLVLLLLVDIIEYLWVHWGAFVFSYFHVLVLVEFCWDILCSHFRGISGITRDNLRNPQRFCWALLLSQSPKHHSCKKAHFRWDLWAQVCKTYFSGNTLKEMKLLSTFLPPQNNLIRHQLIWNPCFRACLSNERICIAVLWNNSALSLSALKKLKTAGLCLKAFSD